MVAGDGHSAFFVEAVPLDWMC